MQNAVVSRIFSIGLVRVAASLLAPTLVRWIVDRGLCNARRKTCGVGDSPLGAEK